MNIRKPMACTLVLTFIFVFMFATSSYAHTKLESSTPKVGEVVTTNLDEITLQFNTNIEVLSSFKLVDESDKEVALEPTEIQENTMIRGIGAGTELENGNYTIKWKIVGKDGHPIEDEYSFQVNLPEQSASAAEPAGADSASNDQEAASEAASSEPAVPSVQSEPEQSIPNQSNFNQVWLYSFIGLVVLLMIIWITMKAVKRRKS